MSKNILVVVHPKIGACQFFRQIHPHENISKDFKITYRHVLDIIPNKELASYQLVQIHKSMVTVDFLRKLKGLQIPSIVDFDDYWNRLVISWGNSARSWHQRKLDKEVFCMRPRGYIRDMPRWNRITLDFLELRTLFLHSSSNPMWKDYLSNHDGVYLIRHKATNKMYVGSAYGDEGGIWGRWNGYVDTHHNNNKGIQNFLLTDENSINDFTFSLLEVFPKGATKAIVISAESFHKDRLGTRDFGLNRN